MACPIHDKINLLLQRRGLLKRDLARALGISPQTATDICKGRSSISVEHLRRLVSFFQLQADYWLDEERLEPAATDERAVARDEVVLELRETGLLDLDKPAWLFERLRKFATHHRQEFVDEFGEPSPEERRVLGFPAQRGGSVGRVEPSTD